MSKNEVRTAARKCDGAYVASEVECANPAVEGNEVITNYNDGGLKLSVDCSFLVGGMCENLETFGMVKKYASMKGTLPCIHLKQVTLVNR